MFTHNLLNYYNCLGLYNLYSNHALDLREVTLIHFDEMRCLFQLFEVPEDALEEVVEEIKAG